MLRYDHYKLHGITRDATLMQIKRAYRERVKNCHPDINPSPKAAAVFRAVHEAYSVLSDPFRRCIYDSRLQYYRKATPPQPEPDLREARKYGPRRKIVDVYPQQHVPPVRPMDRIIFFGLHLTGLLFSLALVSGILIGVTFQGWPVMSLCFSVFGLAVLPDSVQGLRTNLS